MNKQEFLEQLGRALGSRVSGSVVNDNVSYYEEYIATQVRAGKREEDVIAGLGDPRLLARSIADAHKRAETVDDEGPNSEADIEHEHPMKRSYNIPGWLIIAGIILIVVLVLSAAFKVISVLLPLIVPGAIIVFFLRILQSK